MHNFLDRKLDDITLFTERVRAVALGPILPVLTKLHLTPNLISSAKVFVGVAGLIVIQYNLRSAFYVFLLSYPLDLFDGCLARHQATNSDRGKFVDIFTDQILYCLIIFSLISINFASQPLLAYSLFLLPALYLLVAINKNENQPSDWIIQPLARISYYKTTIFVFASLALFYWVGINTFELALIIVNILMSIHFIYSFRGFLAKKNA